MLNQMKAKIIASLNSQTDTATEEIEKALTRPPKPEMGDFSLPCFIFAKQLKKAPPAIAAELQPLISKSLEEEGISCETAGPYLNFRLDKKTIISRITHTVLKDKDYIPQPGSGKTVVIDFSSPNIAKPFSMGHLRSTTIGNSLSAIFKALGYRVERVNHLGDWGTQFGKLICAFRKWGDEKELTEREISYLMELYVRFNNEAKEHPEFDDQARAAFKELEEGNQEAVSLWKKFREISLKEFERIYNLLGVSFDSYAGESFYNDKIEATVKNIQNAGLLEESEGAMVVQMGEDMPPCMIKKSDGATTYAARDLSAIFYRKDEYNFDKLLYVVGAPQALHFKQLFSVMEKMEMPEAKNCAHIPFGQVLINGEMMSTRKGNVIFLEDVIKKAAQLSLAKIAEDNEIPEAELTEEQQQRATAIAVSSIIFFDLKNNRIKDVDFNWEEILNPKGETGVYLQYAHARIHGIMRKFEERTNTTIADVMSNPPAASEENGYPIIMEIARFPEKISYAAESAEPSVISRYLLELTSAFSTYYRANKVINEDNPELSQERMGIVLAVKEILAEGLQLLGITPLQKM